MALRTYGNKTLQDNWFEDRVQSDLEPGAELGVRLAMRALWTRRGVRWMHYW